ncbi:MAG: hypothetical protein JXJ19_02375 [Elusimicrobia bacterium]|nr:hypothetical protein [Elusimicrobiota bacterium]
MSVSKQVRIIYSVMAVAAGTLCLLRADSNFGTTGAQILRMRTSAKIMGRGDTGVAYADDLNALAYNPAGLTQMEGSQAQFTHIFYYVGTSMNSAAFGRKYRMKGHDLALGFKWKYFGTEDTERDEDGKELEDFDIKYAQYSLGAGYQVRERHSIGATLNAVTEKVYDCEGFDIALDLGWHYKFREDPMYEDEKGVRRVTKRFLNFFTYNEREPVGSVGAAIKNIGPNIKTFKGGGSALPLMLAVGAAYEFDEYLDDVIFLCELHTSAENPLGFNAGVETELEGFLFRMGLMYTANTTLTFGASVPDRKWHVDYAFLVNLGLGTTHRISVGVNF